MSERELLVGGVGAAAGGGVGFLAGYLLAPARHIPLLSYGNSFELPDYTRPEEWSLVSGDWFVRGGRYCGGGTTVPMALAVLKEETVRDGLVVLRSTHILGDPAGVCFRLRDEDNYYWYYTYPYYNLVGLIKRVGGADVTLGTHSLNLLYRKAYTLTVLTFADRIQCFLDGEMVLDVSDRSHALGMVGFRTQTAMMEVEDIYVWGLP